MLSANVQLYEIHICRFIHALGVTLFPPSRAWNGQAKGIVHVIREAKATVVAAAQSSTSFVPPLGREKARVFTLNLRNRLIFKAADEEGALESADFLGKKRVIKKSWGYSGGKRSSNC